MAGIFDTGIFDSGVFDHPVTTNGTFSHPPFDTGIFDHAGTVGTFDTGIFDQNIFDNILGPVQPSGTYQYLGSPIQYVTGKRVRYAWDDEEEKKKPKEVIKLGPVRPAQIETGIVHVKAKKHTPNTDRLNWLASENIATESKKRQRIRQMIASDDEWLMSI